MFKHIRGWFETYKKSLFDSYEPPKPTVYKIGNKRYVRTKRISRKTVGRVRYIDEDSPKQS